jgi:hypothetical protein
LRAICGYNGDGGGNGDGGDSAGGYSGVRYIDCGGGCDDDGPDRVFGTESNLLLWCEKITVLVLSYERVTVLVLLYESESFGFIV